MLMSYHGPETSGLPPNKETARQPIVVDGKLYVWATNFGTMKQALEGSPEMHKRATNMERMHFEMRERGIGIVPEQTPVDFNGNELPGFVFYAREELADAPNILFGYFCENFAGSFDSSEADSVEAADLSQHEISVLMGAALEETGIQARLDELGISGI